MIYKAFKLTGRLMACFVFGCFATPLLLLILPCAAFSYICMRSVCPAVVLDDTTWRSLPLRWLNNLQWPDYYLKALEKFTGYHLQ